MALGAALFVLAAFSLVGNTLRLSDAADEFASDSRHVRAQAAALDAVRDLNPIPDLKIERNTELLGAKYRFSIEVAQYYVVSDDYGSTAWTPEELAQQEAAVQETARRAKLIALGKLPLTRTLALLAAALVAGGALLLITRGEDEEPAKQARPGAPNVILIMTDDQSLNSWNREVMPQTFKRMADGGTRFTEGYAIPPLCCPDRASTLTGRYPHNHGVVTNNYNSFIDPEDVLPVWLSEAGYETMIAGKFLNGYERAKKTNQGYDPAPGWENWWVPVGEQRRYFDYEVSVDGDPVSYGSEREDYVTNALTDVATDFMTSEAGGEDPYFLWMTHLAPHFASREKSKVCPFGRGAIPLPADFRRARDAELPIGPDFFEPNVSDKPQFIRTLFDRKEKETEFASGLV